MDKTHAIKEKMGETKMLCTEKKKSTKQRGKSMGENIHKYIPAKGLTSKKTTTKFNRKKTNNLTFHFCQSSRKGISVYSFLRNIYEKALHLTT